MTSGYSSEKQDTDVTDRDSWWIGDVRDTPNPGCYEVTSFLHLLDSSNVTKTYGFKSSGRKRNADPSRKGDFLMPGLYNIYSTFGLNSQRENFLSRSTSRDNTSSLVVGIKDKHLSQSDLDPLKFTKPFIEDAKIPSKYGIFKSKTERFPTIHFKPKEGPSPCQYDSKCQDRRVQMTSSFQSKTPRFKKAQKMNTPGPGAYTRMIQFPVAGCVRDVTTKNHMYFPPGVF